MSAAAAASPPPDKGLELRRKAFWAHRLASLAIDREKACFIRAFLDDEKRTKEWVKWKRYYSDRCDIVRTRLGSRAFLALTDKELAAYVSPDPKFPPEKSWKNAAKATEKVDRLLKVQKAACIVRLSVLSPTIPEIQGVFSRMELWAAKKAYAYEIFCKEVPKGRVDVCRWFLDLLRKGTFIRKEMPLDDSPPRLVKRLMRADDSLRINQTFLRTIRNGVDAWEKALKLTRVEYIVTETLKCEAAVPVAEKSLKTTRKDIQTWIASSSFDSVKVLLWGAELVKREKELRRAKIRLEYVPERAKAIEQHSNTFVANFPFSEACIFLWSMRNFFDIEDKNELNMTPYGSSKIPEELFFHSVERLAIYEIKIDRPHEAHEFWKATRWHGKLKVYSMPAPGLHGGWGWAA